MIHEDDEPSSMPDELLKFVIDDASYFNFGDDWQQVCSIIPEIAGPFSTKFKPGRRQSLISKPEDPGNDRYLEEKRAALRENISNTTTPPEEHLTYDDNAAILQAM